MLPRPENSVFGVEGSPNEISKHGESSNMSIYTLGIDIGSTASKCVMLKDGKEIVAKSLIAVGAGTSGPQRAIAEVLENAGKTEADMAYTLATGYGRNSLEEIADHQMSELSCHARGATFLFPDVHTVIDIGGQDVKVLQIDNNNEKATRSRWNSSPSPGNVTMLVIPPLPLWAGPRTGRCAPA